MRNVRRTEHAYFSLEDDYVLDPVSLLRGIAPAPAQVRADELLAG